MTLELGTDQSSLGGAEASDSRTRGRPVLAAVGPFLEPRSRESSKVLTYSHDGFGLGHMRRNANIASRLVADRTDACALMVVGCPTGHLFHLPKGVDFLRLPSIVKVASNTWEPRSLNVSSARLRDLRASLIAETAKCFQPEAVLVDHLPAGVWRELVPTLKMLKRRPRPPKVILGLRDIIDAPELVCETWEREGIYDLIDTYYDEILVYGSESLFDTTAKYGLGDRFAGRVHYCGYVCAEESAATREDVRAALKMGDSPLVLVTAGGGADAFDMMLCSIAALRIAQDTSSVQAILIAGPLMEDAKVKALRRAVRGLPIRVLTSVSDFMSHLAAADLVVTMGGYNTLVESIRLGKASVVVPRPGPSLEQQIRARLFAQQGLVEMVELASLSPVSLAEVIRRQLGTPRLPSSVLDCNGVEEVVRRLRAALKDHPPGEEVSSFSMSQVG